MFKTPFGILALCTLFAGASARIRGPSGPTVIGTSVVRVTYCGKSDARSECAATQSITHDGCHDMPIINGHRPASAHWEFVNPDPSKRNTACIDLFADKGCNGRRRRVQVPDSVDIHSFEGLDGSLNMMYPCPN